ncbi:hypothetical protein AB0V79_33010 [Mesorhizobium ciceri]|uniref:hypothetical protein n=1 Tax=Mesorhizobium ciceri TaxID=39645 RepID=UPI0007A93CD8|nr:hypothetical protein [Mesorhizobium ciceri]AMY04282.1 hypothetical protein A4R29_32020 [Mesorhizobium ciceri biovar biserrulae]
MDIQTPVRPAQTTAKELVREVLLGPQPGAIISVKATITAVRERGLYLHETDCQLVAMIVDCATKRELFVAFDVRES